ncbi:MAG: hypothetical protein H6581_12970 [Bacteroidia bacterium]|nr:hypothetical protein [Bacteroidia bacterium]
MLKSLTGLILVFVLAQACGESRESAIDKIARQADSLTITFYGKGYSDPKNVVSFLVTNPVEIRRIGNFPSPSQTEHFKCGEDGIIEFKLAETVIFSMEFNLNEDCRHIVHSTSDKSYFNELTTDAVTYLQEKEKEAKAEFQARENIAKMSWMLGKWAYITKNIAFYESWESAGVGKMTGSGESREQGKDPILEGLTIESRQGDIYYVADVPANETPISFLLTEQTDSSLVFQNPTHDDPKMISYKMESDGILHAWIEGQNEAGPTRMDFHFVRQTE